MIVATAFSHTATLDHEGKPGPYSNTQLAVMWLDWCAELGGNQKTELVILGPQDFVMPASVKKWGKVTFVRDRENVHGWPMGPNSAFRQLGWYMHAGRQDPDNEPWLFCEPDCVPLTKDWLAKLVDAYASCGKPFMGAVVPAGVNYPAHMSGNAVYPKDAIQRAPSLVSEKKMNVAWDVRSASEVVPNMATTDLICHAFRRPRFGSLQEFQEMVPASAVLFHSDKYGAIREFLGGGKVTATTAETISRSAAPPPLDQAQSETMPPVYSLAQLQKIISFNVTSETARAKLMAYLHANHFHQKNFGAAIKELASADA